MSFDPKLKQGQSITNNELSVIFQISTQGGMRRSRRKNCLIIVSDPTKSIYEDRWIDNVFHYTGMGLRGDQDVSFMQNKTLAQSDINGVAVFLFEVFEPRKYMFQGRVRLANPPYREVQTDIEGKSRDVWMFPLKLVDNKKPFPIPESLFKSKNEQRTKQARKLSFPELKKRAETAPKNAGTRDVVTTQYDRNQSVVEFVKKIANGICDLCRNAAPFINKKSVPFLECHHIEWLTKGGSDTIDNAAALCPNCHRKMHILDKVEDRKILFEKVREREF